MKERVECKIFLLFEEGSSLGSTALTEAALECAVGGSATPQGISSCPVLSQVCTHTCTHTFLNKKGFPERKGFQSFWRGF